MKKLLFLSFLLYAFATPISAQKTYYTLIAVKYYDTYYAEWGMIDDESYEDRFDGMEFEVWENEKMIGTIMVFQHWFKASRKVYPKIGERIVTEKFDLPCSDIGGEGNNIEFDRLVIISSKTK